MKTTPKDFFLHLGATIVLYIAAAALIDLWYSIINHLLPDALYNYSFPSSIVWPVSILIVLTPILYVVEWVINKDIALVPEKKDIWIRRWRIYLTLFLVVALIGGDLIALINTYLNGEITARFIWKVVTILVVAGTIGKYYFYSIATKWRYASLARRICAWFGIALVAAAVIGGFLIVGSPAAQRAVRFDEQRVNDLTETQYQILNYWQSKGKLPASLQDLTDSISGFSAPTDPETKAPYEYKATANMSFQLCATFDKPSFSKDGGVTGYQTPAGEVSGNWNHEAGRTCFSRTIDPQIYPVNPRGVPKPAPLE